MRCNRWEMGFWRVRPGDLVLMVACGGICLLIMTLIARTRWNLPYNAHTAQKMAQTGHGNSKPSSLYFYSSIDFRVGRQSLSIIYLMEVRSYEE